MTSYEVVRHGVFTPREAPGCSVGDWGCVATGSGRTELEAYLDALVSLLRLEWDAADLAFEATSDELAPEGLLYFVSVRVS